MVYRIGKKAFSTKKEAKDYTRNIINQNENKIINKEHTDFNYFYEMVKLHPDREEKEGEGIISFQIKKNYFGCNALFINQLNKQVDFSWCFICEFKNRTPTHYLNDAMREEIISQIMDYNNNNKIKKCCFCGSSDNIHTDHIIQFKQLKEEYLKTVKKEDIPTSFDSSNITYRSIFKKEDLKFSKGWNVYHKENAKLRYLCRLCNLSRAKYKST